MMDARLIWPNLAVSSVAGESYDVGAVVTRESLGHQTSGQRLPASTAHHRRELNPGTRIEAVTGGDMVFPYQ
jgi:hypothetical protein